ncbi:MAG: ATP-binding protein [Candidatus Heimdallarchaeota archaeon]
MVVKRFDLNIEKILEDWDVHHALREVIANAIDEQILTNTQDIVIFKDSKGMWHVRDYGRGLTYEHLTQKENEEKLRDPRMIGKFGIGLKDALATFDRTGIKILIKSPHGDMTLEKSHKHDFEDIITLHTRISPPSDPTLNGTEFLFDGISDRSVQKAKNLFLRFSGEQLLEQTQYGAVLEKRDQIARIYINGVKVAEEENFLFSYNITSLTKKIRKALNRERTNVGRSAYSERIKGILLACQNAKVAHRLVNDLEQFSLGTNHDELRWIDVQEHAVKILHAKDRVVFLTPQELETQTMMVDEAKSAGYKIVTIPESLKTRIQGSKDITGQTIRDMTQFIKEYHESFEFQFIDLNDLSTIEQRVFTMADRIFALIGGQPQIIKEIKVSETMKKDFTNFKEATGLWVGSKGEIIVKRSQLNRLEEYAGTLLHETAHAISGADDVTRLFEQTLTRFLGKICAEILNETT